MTRQIDASFSDPSSNGDVFMVKASLPANMSDAGGLAVLAWCASQAHSLEELDNFLGQVRQAAVDFFVATPAREVQNKGGRAPYDWEAVYGYPALRLEFAAEIRRAADPSLSKSDARRQALIASRKAAGLGARPNDSIDSDAERLKEAAKYQRGKLEAE